MSEQNVNQNEEQQKENGKVAKKFENNMRKLVALFNGKQIFNKTKFSSDEVTTMIAELVKEDKETLAKEFKLKAAALIKRKQEFDAFARAEQAKMDKAILEKKKEFNKEMENIFGIVDKIEKLEASYYSSLEGLTAGDEPEAEQTEAQTN